MSSLDRDRKRLSDSAQTAVVLVLLLALLFGLYLVVYQLMTPEGERNSLWNHHHWDSYTLQAMAWRDGRVMLDQDYPWLELAIYEDNYYVSFPPFPSVPMLFLSFFCGADTPSNLMVVLYTLGAFAFAFLLCRKFKLSNLQSTVGALFVCFASSAFFNSLCGGVWFLAQNLALCLTLAAFYFLLVKPSHRRTVLAMLLLAFAVGCRPFNAIYYFFFLYVIWKRNHFKIRKVLPHLIAPAIVAVIYMWYNAVRFGNVFEFGHNYLPEFTRPGADQYGQFSWHYISANLKSLFGNFPSLGADGLVYEKFGFCFYVANTIFVLVGITMVLRYYRWCRKPDGPLRSVRETNSVELVILGLCIVIHLGSFLFHKTMGGWQFGSRYTIDVIPAALVFLLISESPLLRKTQTPVLLLCASGVAFHLIGALEMYVTGS